MQGWMLSAVCLWQLLVVAPLAAAHDGRPHVIRTEGGRPRKHSSGAVSLAAGSSGHVSEVRAAGADEESQPAAAELETGVSHKHGAEHALQAYSMTDLWYVFKGEPHTKLLRRGDDYRAMFSLCVGLCFMVSMVGSLQLFTQGAFALPLTLLGFVCCSASMLLVNKLAVYFVAAPATVLASQFLFCAFILCVLGSFRICDVEGLRWAGMKSFGPAGIMMVATMFVNLNVLEHTNVDTLILFRSVLPLITLPLERVLLGRAWPSSSSFLALLGVTIGTGLYLYFEGKAIQLKAYVWISIWLAFLLFDTVFIKHVITNVKMSTFTRVYYMNALGLLPCGVYSAAELSSNSVLKELSGTGSSGLMPALVIGASCIVGMALSYFSFHTRDQISGTAFLIVGHSCKILTIFMNVFIWDKHASPTGLAALFLCLFSAAFYRDGPLPSKPAVDAAASK